MPDEYAAKPAVEVDGSPLSHDCELLLERVVVDGDLVLPDMFVLRFRDPDRDVIERSGLQIASKVRVLAGPAGKVADEPLITGEVTGFEAEFDAAGSHAVVRGYDYSHRLHRGRTTETYRNVTDSDIARKVAKRAGLQTGRVDETKTTHRQVSQVNTSDWQFLKSRARETGCEMSVVEDKVEFRLPPDASAAPATGDLGSVNPLQLVMGANLVRFRPRVTSAEQVSEVQVRGWDPEQKQVLLGTAPASTTSVVLSLDPAQMAAKFGDPVHVCADTPWAVQSELDVAAKVIADRIGSAFSEAEGSARGNPVVAPGATVSVGLVGEPFEGMYTVTTARHVFDGSGYQTHFSVTGRQQRSLLGLSSTPANGSGSAGDKRSPGVVIAQVTNARDPNDQGRVKVSFPWLSDSYESDWARVVQAGAGPNRGLVVVPEVNDEVLVAFEHGDVRRPYVLGGLYNGVDKPLLGDAFVDTSIGGVNRRGFVSKHGHSLVFLDSDDKDGVALFTGDKELRISLNKTETRIKVTSSGDVVIEAKGDVSISGTGDVSIEGQSVEIKAKTGVSVDGGGGNVTVKGTQIQLT